MSLTIKASIQGQHGTVVDEPACLALVEQALATFTQESDAKLELYPVQVRRYARTRGVYATGYNENMLNAISLDLFIASDEPFGRAGIIIFPNEQTLIEGLSILSPRLHEVYIRAKTIHNAIDFTQVQDRQMQSSTKLIKKSRHARQEGDYARSGSHSLANMRGHFKKEKTRCAYGLFIHLCENEAPPTPQLLDELLSGKGQSVSDLILDVVTNLYIQFGLVEPGSLAITPKAIDLADQFVEELNRFKADEWEQRKADLQREEGRRERRCEELEKALKEAKEALGKASEELKSHIDNPRVPATIPSSVCQ